jgi:hypothetical protein
MKKLLAVIGLVTLFGAGCATEPLQNNSPTNAPQTNKNNEYPSGAADSVDIQADAQLQKEAMTADQKTEQDAMKLETNVNAQVMQDKSYNP